MLKRALLVALVLLTSTAMAAEQKTEHTTKSGEKITVSGDGNGHTKSGGKYGKGESGSAPVGQANKDVKADAKASGDPVVKSVQK
jgi:hypothetical protein